jgi:hypothetical protein
MLSHANVKFCENKCKLLVSQNNYPYSREINCKHIMAHLRFYYNTYLGY